MCPVAMLLGKTVYVFKFYPLSLPNQSRLGLAVRFGQIVSVFARILCSVSRAITLMMVFRRNRTDDPGIKSPIL